MQRTRRDEACTIKYEGRKGMEMELISIIIPIYNTEKYLDRCLTSVVNSSYQNIEILLVDDGSTDASADICDGWAAKDGRIRVIHKENGGVSSARNEGIQNISQNSKYLLFVDSDDYIYENTVQLLFEAITSGDYQFAANHTVEDSVHFRKEPQRALEYLTSNGSYVVYEKIYLSEIIVKNGLLFDVELRLAEDTLFVRQYLTYCSNIKLISKELYFYSQENENSLTKKPYPQYYLCYKKKLDALIAFLDTLALTEKEKQGFLSQRAILGINSSAEHYYTNFDPKEFRALFEKTVALLRPYVTTLEVNNRRLTYIYRIKGLAGKTYHIGFVCFQYLLFLRIRSGVIYLKKWLCAQI